MSLFHKYNNEDILIRGVIAGILDVLNNKISYGQVWSDTDQEEIKIPWYYNQSGDERFMQDMYTHYGDCLPPRPADGNFDFVPRGIITYNGSAINAERITSRYVQGRYVKEENGQLNQYVSFLYSIPLNVTFNAQIWVDTHITALKVEQEIREIFYRNVTFYIYYKGMRVGCTAGFPETYNVTKNIEYSFESQNRIQLDFELEVETYQPVFDPTTEVEAQNRMKNIAYNLYDVENLGDNEIVVTSPQSGITFPKEVPLWIQWNKTKENAIVNKVDITYEDVNTKESGAIAVGAPNREFYIWRPPSGFNDYQEPNIIWEETDDTFIIKDPVVKIIPDLSTGIISEDSFHAMDGGYFKTPTEQASIPITLEMKDDDGNISYTEDKEISINLVYNKIDKENPVSLRENFKFPGTVDYKEINIKVYNSEDRDVYGQTNNIKIV